MNPLSVTLLARAAGQLEIRLEDGGPPMVCQTPEPDLELLEDLHGQVASGQAPPAAVGAMADLLGRLLFAGEAGEALREALDQDPERLILLATDDQHARWPWELARDPITGHQPVLDGAGLVRVGGAPVTERTYGPRAVLVVPGQRGQARLDALESATRHVARKNGIEVFPADPPTGPGVRRQLALGATVVHLDADSRGGTVDLDDGAVPVERLGLDEGTWLVVLGGAETTKDAAMALREAGVPLVLGRQMELKPHETGAIDRELYRALATGASAVDATRRVRRALARLAGRSDGRWAGLTLWAAPPIPGEACEATRAFPPPQHTAGAVDLGTTGRSAEAPAPVPVRPGGVPMPAAAFVRQTIRQLRDAPPDQVDSELAGRAAALRLLGSQLAETTEADGLAADQRVAHLADRFVAGLGRADLPLQAPADLSDRLEAACGQACLSATDLSRAAHGVLAGAAVQLVGADGADPLEAAQALCEGGFGYWLQWAEPDAGTPLVGGPAGPGWLVALARMAWRRDELDVEHPEQPPARTRMPLVVRRRAGWAHFPGGWLVVDTRRWPLAEIERALRAVEAGAVSTLGEDGRPWRLPLPADLRLLLVGDRSAWPGVPRFRVRPGTLPSEVARALRVAEGRLGPAEDPGMTTARHTVAEQVVATLRLLRVWLPVPAATVDGAVAYAIQRGPAAEGTLDDTLRAWLGEHLRSLPGDHRAALAEWFLGQPGRMLALMAQGDEEALDRELLCRLGEHLDRDAPVTTPRVADAARFVGLSGGRLVTTVAEWTKAPGLTLAAPCPGTAALLRQGR
ncbi:MAG: hypothetical protein H6702_02770 [Myxococcales bacterium]|nr:hypothetical protein [Myxococcales bacterium]